MKSVTLKVEGLRCDGCAERVRTRVSSQPGVKTTEVSYQQGQARVLYDPGATDEDRLAEAIQDLGYRVVARARPADARTSPP